MRHEVELQLAPPADGVTEADIEKACLPDGVVKHVKRKQSAVFLVEFDSPDEADGVARKFATTDQCVAGCRVVNARLVLPVRNPAGFKAKVKYPPIDSSTQETVVMKSRMTSDADYPTSVLSQRQTPAILNMEQETTRSANEANKPFHRQQIAMPQPVEIGSHQRRLILAVEACLQLSKPKLTISADFLQSLTALVPNDFDYLELSVEDIIQNVGRYACCMRLLERAVIFPSTLHTLDELLRKHNPPFGVIMWHRDKLEPIAISVLAFDRFIAFDPQNRQGKGPQLVCDNFLSGFAQRLRFIWPPTMRDDDIVDENIDVYIYKIAFSETLPWPDFRCFERRRFEGEQREMRREIQALRREQQPSKSLQPKATFNCAVCQEAFSVEDIFRLSTCPHRLCRTCARSLILNDMARSNLPLRCPVCRQELIIEDAEFVLEPQEVYDLRIAEIARETKRQNDQAFESKPCVVCQSEVRRLDNDRVICPTCATRFCFRCGQILPAHNTPHANCLIE